MHFINLPDDIFIDIFTFLDEEWHTVRSSTFAALRLTCKQLLPLASGPFYSALRLKMERKDLTDLVTQAEMVGHHVRELNLDLLVTIEQASEDDLESKDNLLASLINQLPNVRSLTVHTLSVITIELPGFIKSMRTLKHVRHLQIIEVAPPTRGDDSDPIRCPVSDGIVYEVVNSSGSQLLSLVFDGQSSLRLETFNAIRRIPTNLETLSLGECIDLDCRAALCEEVEWACRNSLQHLGFYDCRGAHSGGVTCGVGSGLWSTCLRSLELCKSGDHSDARTLPYAIDSQSQPQALERAHFEHAFDWEIVLLSRLRVKELTLTLLPRKDTLQIMRDPGSFRGTNKLILGSKSPGSQFDDELIRAACGSRGLELSFDGAPILGCTCPHGQM